MVTFAVGSLALMSRLHVFIKKTFLEWKRKQENLKRIIQTTQNAWMQ